MLFYSEEGYLEKQSVSGSVCVLGELFSGGGGKFHAIIAKAERKVCGYAMLLTLFAFVEAMVLLITKSHFFEMIKDYNIINIIINIIMVKKLERERRSGAGLGERKESKKCLTRKMHVY